MNNLKRDRIPHYKIDENIFLSKEENNKKYKQICCVILSSICVCGFFMTFFIHIINEDIYNSTLLLN